MNYSEHVGSLSLYTVIAVRPLLAEKKNLKHCVTGTCNVICTYTFVLRL